MITSFKYFTINPLLPNVPQRERLAKILILNQRERLAKILILN